MTYPADAQRFGIEEKKLWWIPCEQVDEDEDVHEDVEWYRGLLPDLRRAMLKMYPE